MYNKSGKNKRHDNPNHKGGKLSFSIFYYPLSKDQLFLLLYVDDGAICLRIYKMQF